MSSRGTSRPPLASLPETRVFLISLAHGVNDMYAAFLQTFIPYIKMALGLDYALSGMLSLIVGFCHIIVQPVVGYLADHMRRPWLIAIGPLICGFGAVMIPNAVSYGGALFFAGLWGVGSALFHPQGSGGVGYVSRPEKLSLSLTIFNIMGTLGVLLSPLVAVSVVNVLGLERLWVTLLPPLLLAPLIWLSMPCLREGGMAGQAPQGGFIRDFFSIFATLFPIWGIAFLRDFTFVGVRFFLPLKMAEQGDSLESIGTILFCITLGGALAMIPAERIARRVSFRKILFATMTLGSFLLIAASLLEGLSSFALYVAGVSCVYSSMPMTVAIAQTLLPQARSAASSIAMGLAWGTANAASYPVGLLADRLGINMTLLLIGILPLLSLLFLLFPAFRRLEGRP